nr:hypothetical protein [Stenotrophomonas maltophilia]
MKDKITAAELMDRLMSDPEFVRREQEREAQRIRTAEILAKAEAGLVRELRGAGLNVDSVWDLVGWNGDNDAALRVLLAHAPLPYPERVREGIVRALTTPGVRKWWPDILEMYESDTLALSPEMDYLIGGVLSAAADDTVIDDVIRLASDRNGGSKRVLLLLALKKSRKPRAKMLLNELRSDPVLGKEVKRMRRLERLQGKV